MAKRTIERVLPRRSAGQLRSRQALRSPGEPHNIANVDPEQPRLFRSQGLEGGDKYTFLFAKAGTYKYICSVHPRMEGTIVVR